MLDILWAPNNNLIKNCEVNKFINFLNSDYKQEIQDFNGLYNFSINNRNLFWHALLIFSNIIIDGSLEPVLINEDNLLSTRWFPNTKLNFTENLIGNKTDLTSNAITFWSEDKIKRKVSYQELISSVNSLRNFFKEKKLATSDRVSAITANSHYTIFGSLATNAEGAIWSSCSPDFGVAGILDRFDQIKPKILIACTDYFYKGKLINITDKIEKVLSALNSVESVVTYSLSGETARLNTNKEQVTFSEILNKNSKDLAYQKFNFDHPLYIMFSSGTTGKPKCIVHGTGGTLLNHLKEHRLHTDLKLKDKFFYNTTCGWMMWNWLISGLASGAEIMLYDGFPLHNNYNILLDYIDSEKINIFGTSAGYIQALQKAGLSPINTHDLSTVRTILSTGSVLPKESFDYIYQHISKNVQLSSISGGTDILGCFALGSPMLPVIKGELQTRGLGTAVEVYNDQGLPIIEQCGELVCTKSFPNMPIYFWNDPDNAKYKKAYFETFPNVWRHGDFVELKKSGGMQFYGRSDATLNPGGVRIGTAEIYSQLELFSEINSAIVVAKKIQADEEIALFIKLQDAANLNNEVFNNELKNKVRKAIKENISPRHVPKYIFMIPDLPITRSGKISELAVKKIINFQAVDNTEALANPECLEFFKNLSFD